MPLWRRPRLPPRHATTAARHAALALPSLRPPCLPLLQLPAVLQDPATALIMLVMVTLSTALRFWQARGHACAAGPGNSGGTSCSWVAGSLRWAPGR